ncbi:MAG: hypothetical protein ACK6AH_01465, partial [Gemmatimonadota bacterium]
MHPLTGTAADLVWLLPLLPFLGFVANGWLSLRGAVRARVTAHPTRLETEGSRHPQFTLVNVIGVGSVVAAFGVAIAVFAALAGAPDAAGPCVPTDGAWLPARGAHTTRPPRIRERPLRQWWGGPARRPRASCPPPPPSVAPWWPATRRRPP